MVHSHMVVQEPMALVVAEVELVFLVVTVVVGELEEVVWLL